MFDFFRVHPVASFQVKPTLQQTVAQVGLCGKRLVITINIACVFSKVFAQNSTRFISTWTG